MAPATLPRVPRWHAHRDRADRLSRHTSCSDSQFSVYPVTQPTKPSCQEQRLPGGRQRRLSGVTGVGHGNVDSHDLPRTFALEHVLRSIPLRGNDEQRVALGPAESAREAAPIDGDGLQYPAAFGTRTRDGWARRRTRRPPRHPCRCHRGRQCQGRPRPADWTVHRHCRHRMPSACCGRTRRRSTSSRLLSRPSRSGTTHHRRLAGRNRRM